MQVCLPPAGNTSAHYHRSVRQKCQTEVVGRSGRQAPICLVRYGMLQTNMTINTRTVLYTKFNYYYSNHACSNIKLTWLAAPLHVCNASAYISGTVYVVLLGVYKVCQLERCIQIIVFVQH